MFVIHILSKLDRTLKKRTVSSSITIQSLATMYPAAMYTVMCVLVVDQSHYCIGTKHYKLHKFAYLAVFSTDFEVVSQNLKVASRSIARAQRAQGTRGFLGHLCL